MYQANVYNIMIGCPSDITKEEVQTVFEVIHEWNADNSIKQGIVLLPMHWSQNSYPLMGNEPQKIINKQITDISDVIICLFASKVGTKTSTHESGTIEELYSHIERNKPAMVLFKKQITPTSADDITRLLSFKDYLSQKGLYAEYNDISDLHDSLQHHITKLVNDKLYNVGITEQISVSLNEEEIGLLKRWIGSNELRTWYIDYTGGRRLYVLGNLQIEAPDAREKAKLDSFMKKLQKMDMLDFLRNDKSGKPIFQINQNAIDYIDSLTK